VLGLNERPNSLTIKNLKLEIDKLNKSIEDNNLRLDTLKSNIESDLTGEIDAVIAKYYTQINRDNSEEMFKKMGKEISENIRKIVESNINEVFKNFSYTVNSVSHNISGDKFKIDDVYETYTYTTKTRNRGILGGKVLCGREIR